MLKARSNVCVVGGGPAGLAAAIALTNEKYAVTLVDCGVPPMDKACGEGLMPDSIAALRELGVEIPADVGFSFRGIRFADAHSAVFADFPNGVAKGLRRTVLHQLLVRHAIGQGVSFVWNAKHVLLTVAGVSLDKQFIKADLVVAADGQHSEIRRQAGLHRVTRETRRFGFRRHYQIAPWSSYMELHWGTGSQIYVTPIAPDEICVTIMSRYPGVRLGHALSGFPELRERLGDAEPVSSQMGALSVSRTLACVHSNNVVLIGDASGSVDAVAGQGMCLGFKQALALAAALKSGDIQRYQGAHKKLMKRPRAMASLMLTMDRDGPFRSLTLAGLARYPEIFKSLLAIHVGGSPFGDLPRFGVLPWPSFSRRLKRFA